MDFFERIEYERQWLVDNPDFLERPATIDEFLGPEYLNIAERTRPGIRQALIDIFGEEVQIESIARVQYAMVTGAIGIGKTTFASIALPYMCHWVLCLRDPQAYFGLMAGSRIAFMQMSTSEAQAREVIFGDLFARINHSPWFQRNAPHDPKYTKQIRFPGKDIWILPGDSSETTFEGYNILAGIIDEMDSHKQTKDKDYAEVGFTTIEGRINSRFGKRGLLICIGQMKKTSGFAARKYKEFMADPEHCHVTRMTLWESFGWNNYLTPEGKRDSFIYDIKRRNIMTNSALMELFDVSAKEGMIEVPNEYLRNFQNAPEKALRDLAGIPPATEDPFISLIDRIEACRDKWHERFPTVGSPVDDSCTSPKFTPWFGGTGDPRKRALHIDYAYSADGDALGMAMGHVAEIVEGDDGELAPYIVIDFLCRVKASPGTEIMFSDIRRIIYDLRDMYGFRLKNITMDSFNATDNMQQLRKKRFHVEELSVDKTTLPYEDLRAAIYEGRLEFPKYMTKLNRGDFENVEIVVKELAELSYDGNKVDHPASGSKDVADALAGCVSTLIGKREYRRGVSRLTMGTRYVPGEPLPPLLDTAWADLIKDNGGLRAPTPPKSSQGGMIPDVPRHLRPR